MNLLLLKTDQIFGNEARVTGRQLKHLRTVNQLAEGDSVRVGELNGLMGNASVKQINKDQAVLSITLDSTPPPPLPLTLIMAMPRPKMLRRTLQSVSSLGVKKIYLINSARVEKSFWQTPLLSEQAIEEQLILGLEQSRDTALPQVYLRKLFKPFVEDELGEITAGTAGLAAHPSGVSNCPVDIKTPTTLVVGPEGGFIPYEVEKLENAGVKAVKIGPRILRVETAIPVLISRLFPA